MDSRTESSPATDTSLVYLRAQQIIQEMIEGPDFSPGDKIPSERALAERLGISRMTIRKALDNLVRMGLLERHSKSATRIVMPHVTRTMHDRRSPSLSQMVQSAGGRAGSRLLHFENATASAKMADRLQVRAGAPLFIIRRLRLVNDLPFCLETSYLPAERAPLLAAEDLAGDQSLYALLSERYGIDVGIGEDTISVAPAAPMEADLLGLENGAAMLLLRSLVRDTREMPIEYLTSVNHPGLVVFRTTSHGAETTDG